jgi:esterase/lipase
MGAVVALELAAQHPEIKGLMLFAPAIKIPLLWLAKLISVFKPYREKKGKDDGLPWKGYNVHPYRGTYELYQMQKHTRQRLNKVSQPTLVFTGGKDHTIAPESAEIILRGIRSNYKCHIHLEESSHVILIDKELDRAAKYVMNFIHQFTQRS